MVHPARPHPVGGTHDTGQPYFIQKAIKVITAVVTSYFDGAASIRNGADRTRCLLNAIDIQVCIRPALHARQVMPGIISRRGSSYLLTAAAPSHGRTFKEQLPPPIHRL